MPWTREEKIICVTAYLETKSFQTVHAKFCIRFNFKNFPLKAKFIVGFSNFMPQGKKKSLNKNAENPKSGKKLTTIYPDDVDAVGDSVEKSPKRSL